MSEEPIGSDKPTDRLTRLCAAMTKTLDEQPEYGDDIKCIVFLDDGERGGLQLHGYENDLDALVDLFIHLKAMFAAQGKTLMFAPIQGRAQDQ